MSNCIASWSEFARKIGKIQQRVTCASYNSWSKDSMGQPVLFLIHVFQKMFETEIKHKLLMEINKESLRGQYGSDCYIFWRLITIMWKDNMDQTVLSFMIFLSYPVYRKPSK